MLRPFLYLGAIVLFPLSIAKGPTADGPVTSVSTEQMENSLPSRIRSTLSAMEHCMLLFLLFLLFPHTNPNHLMLLIIY